MKRALIPLLALLTGCAMQPATTIYLPTYPRNEIQVTIVEYDTHEALQAAWGRPGVKQAWSEWKGTDCTIHVLKITQDNWYENMIARGHELLHCSHGYWHSE